jgi:cation-transporting ATPase 13A3/4/5
MFEYRFIRWEYKEDRQVFKPIVFNSALAFDELRSRFGKGIETEFAQQKQRARYGPCDIIVPKPNTCKLLVSEVLNPFYIFQVFAMALWFYDGYWVYSLCIFVVSTGSVIAEMVETTEN